MLTELQRKMIADAPDQKTRDLRYRLFTQPTGAKFRRTLKRLSETMCDHASQIHVELNSEMPRANIAWDQLAGATHHNFHGIKRLGYIDHIIEQEGKRIRVIRVLFAEEGQP